MTTPLATASQTPATTSGSTVPPLSTVPEIETRRILAATLAAIEAHDPSIGNGVSYRERNFYIVSAVAVALDLGLNAGFAVDPATPDWPVAYIDLPHVGQVSWHLPEYIGVYDGHTTAEKYERTAAYVKATP